MNVAAVILAGGEGARIGGGKPLRTLGGERLIDRALRQARQWSSIVAVAVRDPAQVSGCDAPLIEDRAGLEGPLGGLAAALSYAGGLGCELLLTIPADMPFLPADLLERLSEAVKADMAALASSGGHTHPVCGLWHVAAHDRLEEYAQSGRRSLKGLAEALGCAVVEWPAEPLDPFFNINSPEDLAAAELLLAG